MKTLRLFPENTNPEPSISRIDTIPSVDFQNERMDFTETPQADDPGYTLRVWEGLCRLQKVGINLGN